MEPCIVGKCKPAARNLTPVNINKVRLVASGSYCQGKQIKFACEIHAYVDSAQKAAVTFFVERKGSKQAALKLNVDNEP